MSAFRNTLHTVLLILSATLAGCGGGSGGGSVAGIGGTGQIASGTITAFGSIFVNGIEFFDVSNATCIIDGVNRSGANCQADLQLGMVVEVNGSFDSATGSGSAVQVVYDDDVDGPVNGIVPVNPGPADVIRTFTVLNTSVQIDSASTKFSGAKGFNNLADNDVVEISGFFDNAGILHATYVNTKNAAFVNDSTLVEVKGNVSGVTPASGASAAGDTFVVTALNGATLNIVLGASGADLSDVPGGAVQNNMFVEVRGTYNQGTGIITANLVQQENIAIGSDGDEVSVEGLVTGFISPGAFMVDGQSIDASSATFSPTTLATQLANGIKVEVEGSISGSTLIASKIESRDNGIKAEALVFSVDAAAGTVTLQFNGGDKLVVQVNSQTQMEDKLDATPDLNLSIIQPGDFLEVRGFINTDPASDITASEIRRNTPDDEVLQGPLDGPVTTGVVSILGVQFTTDALITTFDDGASNSATFYATVSAGCIVKAEDGTSSTLPDAIADEVNLESCP